MLYRFVMPIGLHPIALASGALVTWLVHIVITSVVWSLIWSVMARLVRHLTTPELVLLVAIVIGGLFVFARNRDQRGRW